MAHHDLEKCYITEYHPYTASEYFYPDKGIIREFKKMYKENQNVRSGRIVSGEVFVTDKNREEIINKFAPLCVDMESSSIAHVYFVNNVPVTITRSITDFKDENAETSFETNFTDKAIDAISIVYKAIGVIESFSKR